MDFLCLKVSFWEGHRKLVHGFLGRHGGKSQGPFSSLNLSFNVGDEPEVVKDNLCDVKKAVGLHDLRVVTLKQVHGNRIVDVKDKHLKEAGEGDGMVTGESGVFLGILTADCVPLLFLVPDKKIVGAVHAGWRGTLGGISAQMIHYLDQKLGVAPEAVEVALGPSIGPCCYEVQRDVAGTMAEKWGEMATKSLYTQNGKSYLDLREHNRLQLESLGVPSSQIYSVGPCTSCTSKDFFSYRRQGGKTGHQMSFIGWL